MQTQPFPAACGLTTLAVALNAMHVDPRRVWRAPWRWYEESALLCCSDEHAVRSRGVTLAEFACVACCHGLRADVHRRLPDTRARDLVRRHVSDPDPDPGPDCAGKSTDVDDDGDGAPSTVLVVSFSRRAIGQTGSGHFSPVAAYDADTDSVLVLDTARFKYPPFWVSLPALNAATHGCDPSTGLPRGFVVLTRERGDDAPSAVQQLAVALDSVAARLQGRSAFSAAEIAALVLDKVGSTVLTSCLSLQDVPVAVSRETEGIPLFQEVRAGERQLRLREALAVLACLAAVGADGLQSDAVAIPVLGGPWLEMTDEFRAVVERLANSFTLAADGIEVAAVE